MIILMSLIVLGFNARNERQVSDEAKTKENVSDKIDRWLFVWIFSII